MYERELSLILKIHDTVNMLRGVFVLLLTAASAVAFGTETKIRGECKPQGFRHLTSSVVHDGFSSYYSL